MNLNNLKIAILLIIVFVLASSAGFYFYQKQIVKNVPLPQEATSSPTANFPTSVSPSPTVEGFKSIPNSQPQTGSDTQDVKNIGIQIESPKAQDTIFTGLHLNGRANVLGNIVVVVKDANGNILGEGKTIACIGYDACPFETTVYFSQPSTQTGIVEVYNPSGIDDSPKYLQTIVVRF